MKRHIPGLHTETKASGHVLDGAFLVRVDRVFFRWHPQRPFYALRFVILEPNEEQGCSFTGRLYCSPKAIWKSCPMATDSCVLRPTTNFPGRTTSMFRPRRSASSI